MHADGSEFATVRRLHPNDRIGVDSHNLSQVSLLNSGYSDTALRRNMIPTERAEGSADEAVALPELCVMTALCKSFRVVSHDYIFARGRCFNLSRSARHCRWLSWRIERPPSVVNSG